MWGGDLGGCTQPLVTFDLTLESFLHTDPQEHRLQILSYSSIFSKILAISSRENI